MAGADLGGASGAIASAGQAHGFGPLVQAAIGSAVGFGIAITVLFDHGIVGLVGATGRAWNPGADIQVFGHQGLCANCDGLVGLFVTNESAIR